MMGRIKVLFVMGLYYKYHLGEFDIISAFALYLPCLPPHECLRVTLPASDKCQVQS